MKSKTTGNPAYNSAGCTLLDVRFAKYLEKVRAGIAGYFVGAGPRRVICEKVEHLWLLT